MGFLPKKLRSSRSASSFSKQKSKKLSKKSSHTSRFSPEQIINDEDGDGDAVGREQFVTCSCISLATGSFTLTGVTSLTASLGNNNNNNNNGRSSSAFSNRTFDEGSYSEEDEVLLSHTQQQQPPLQQLQPSKIFLRTADLPHMKISATHSRHSSFSSLSESELVNHIHIPSSTPPLSTMEHDMNESWVALDDGNGNKAPLAEAAMEALVKTALEACMDRSMWTPNGGTAKLLKSGVWEDTIFDNSPLVLHSHTNHQHPPNPQNQNKAVRIPHPKGSKGESDVLVWSGTWSHTYYGHDLPAIRCEAIVNMSPSSLAKLLVDSSRVKEYNKMSIGRDDILVLHEDDKWVTKICVAKTKPPMLGKILVLKNLLHMEELPGGGEEVGYVIVSRAVAHAQEDDAAADVEDPSKVVHSEMLMGLNVIRAVEGEEDRCVLINLNHLRSPMIPMMFAKKLGLSAAVNFINDIRALC